MKEIYFDNPAFILLTLNFICLGGVTAHDFFLSRPGPTDLLQGQHFQFSKLKIN